MRTPKTKWRADRGTRAVRLIASLESSILRLGDEDLLDLHDIFASDPGSPIDQFAQTEMRRRSLPIP